VWRIQVYPISDYKKEFNVLTNTEKDSIDELLEELIVIDEPEIHRSAVDTVNKEGFSLAVKYQHDNIVLMIAIDRTMEDTNYEVDTITLFSCSK